jgi:phosphatidylserine/phosphatidylglycerophosphate/cardiolipin synthase-like enzyme
MLRHWLLALLVAAGMACDTLGLGEPESPGGKADDFAESREVEVVLTDPFCDVCTQADKDVLRQRSLERGVTAAVIREIEAATETLDIAQFTFSVREIERAILDAKSSGVKIRLAINAAQKQGDTVANRLLAAGVDVRFIEGKTFGSDRPPGLQHAKFLIADGESLLTGSNNWSSTGTTINEENTTIIRSTADDPILAGFACHFEAMWDGRLSEAGACSNDVVAFTPSSAPIAMLKEEIRGAGSSVDVLMHHLLFDDLLTVLAQAGERGVRVRIVVNDGDQGEHTGSRWDRLRAAGAEIRYKSVNPDTFQLMHHKLAIVDDRVLINGSGNWSGSAFFNNYENYIRYADPDVVRPYRELFARLWTWSLTEASRAAGLTAAEQHAATTGIFFGNLHAHVEAHDGERALDDGETLRRDQQGVETDLAAHGSVREAARFAYEYARDMGEMDFLALSPHTTDDRADDPPDLSSMSRAGYAEMVDVAADVTTESSGGFVALPSMEWNTNSAGNHVGVLGSGEIAKIARDRFDLMYGEFLPSRAHAGERPMIQLNHPRTFRRHDALEGSWDQIFDVNLMEIPRNGERTKKFNDFGLDDFEPLRSVREDWLLGAALPDPAVVAATLNTVRRAAAPYARLMEVTVGRGTELGGEEAINPSLLEDPETGEITRFTRVHSDWDYYLLNGWALAPTAPHDNHMANWGTGHSSRTAIAAAALTERDLLEAVDARAVYASEDENLALRLYADGRAPMGSRLATRSDAVTLSIDLRDPDYSGAYQINAVVGTVGADAVRIAETINTSEPVTELSIDLGVGQHFVYIEVLEIDADRMAWSAPIFIERI